MCSESAPDLSLFLSILQTLEAIQAPYMVIGAFAAAAYGASRTTYDIDIVVELDEAHMIALAAAYPLPRYYADPVQMRSAVCTGRMFNIIDTIGERRPTCFRRAWCPNIARPSNDASGKRFRSQTPLHSRCGVRVLKT